MRRITFALMSTLAAVILLFSYRTSTRGTAAVAGGNAPGIVSGGTSSSAPPSAGTGTTGGTGTGTGKATVVNGSVAQTRWGPVQVRVTITGGKITDVQALQYPNGNNRDAEINSYALPQLHDQAIAAQSARIDGVSGATVTTDGYTSSLQSALDAANF
jgi:uncharacterized protein with FMN-binding domain